MTVWNLSPSVLVSYCNQCEMLTQWLVEHLPHHPCSMPHYLSIVVAQDVHALKLKNKHVSTALMDTVHSKSGNVLRVSWLCACSYVVFWYKMFFTIEGHYITKESKFICIIKDTSILSISPWRMITVSEPPGQHTSKHNCLQFDFINGKLATWPTKFLTRNIPKTFCTSILTCSIATNGRGKWSWVFL